MTFLSTFLPALRPVFCSLLGLFFLAGCKPPAEGPVEPAAPRPVVTVTVPTPQATVSRAFSGQAKAADGTDLAFEVGGRVSEVFVKEGQTLAVGDPIARLDASEFQNQLDGARASATEAEQALRRTQQLLESGNASKSQLESAVRAEKAANTSLKSAEKRVRDCLLVMPYPGRIGSVIAEAKQVVAAAQPIASIQGDTETEFSIGIPTELVAEIVIGMASDITFGGHPDAPVSAQVHSVASEVSSDSTYRITLHFKAAPDFVRDGMDGEATLTLPNPLGSVLAIPSVCVVPDPAGGAYVWVVTASTNATGTATVARQKVQVGQLRGGGTLEVLDGLKPGEQIVSRGVNRIEDGMTVRLLATPSK